MVERPRTGWGGRWPKHPLLETGVGRREHPLLETGIEDGRYDREKRWEVAEGGGVGMVSEGWEGSLGVGGLSAVLVCADGVVAW
jgi:hypothetical protein